MDVSDEGTAAEEKFREEDLARQKRAARLPDGLKPGDWRKLSLKWCRGIGCGERIPDERRRAYPGVEFCTQCQARKEQRERTGR